MDYLLILLLFGSLVAAYGYEVRDVCRGTSSGMTVTENTPEGKLQALRRRYEGCQYVEGNLEIVGLDADEHYNADLSFLNSIREVSGYVLIANVYVRNFTMKNLTIIHGQNLFYAGGSPCEPAAAIQCRGYALFVSLNFKNENISIGMRLMNLRKLAEISKGDVFFENNNILCYAATNINWNAMFTDSSRQKAIILQSASHENQPCESNCHSSCTITVPPNSALNSSQYGLTHRFCWAPGPKNCQRMNKATCDGKCEGGSCFGPEVDQCCHPQCAGGCDGPTKFDCWRCKNYYSDGSCEPFCPQRLIYDNQLFKWVFNPNRKFVFGKMCVKECPDGFFQHKGYCVKSCPKNFKQIGSRCVECTGSCINTRICQINWDHSVDFVNSKNIHELEGCQRIEGHLKILYTSITGDPYSKIPPMSLTELDKLNSISEITDYLLIQNLDNFGISNFTFLSNLKFVFGRRTDTYGASLNVIGNDDLEFLGFSSLKKISSGHVIIESNPKLCYLEGIKWRKILNRNQNLQSFVARNANQTSYCLPRNQICHQECRNGCWGPGADMCVKCQHYKYKNECLNNCNSRPMLYSASGSLKHCLECSPECKRSCTGPGADQCDACRNYKDGPFCVSRCPADDNAEIYKYPDVNGVCRVHYQNNI